MAGHTYIVMSLENGMGMAIYGWSYLMECIEWCLCCSLILQFTNVGICRRVNFAVACPSICPPQTAHDKVPDGGMVDRKGHDILVERAMIV